MHNIILPLPKSLIGKRKSFIDVRRYFDVNTVDELLLEMRQLQQQGYLTYEIFVDKKYMELVDSRLQLMIGSERIATVAHKELILPDLHGIKPLYNKITTQQALMKNEINMAVGHLPLHVAEKYIQFKVTSIDHTMLRSLLDFKKVNKKLTGRRAYNRLEYKGLVFDGNEVSYKGRVIPLSFQDMYIVKAFLRSPETILTPDIFSDRNINPDIFTRSHYSDINKTLGRLIPKVHKQLRPYIGDCIFNSPGNGWKLVINK